MRLEFLGGAGEVGRLAMLLYDGNTKYLFDYGFNPSKPPEYPMRAPRVDYAFISHSHVDHSGMVPVMSAWEDTGIYATSPTISTASLLMEDSVKVGEAEGHPPPYNRSDIKNVCRRLSCVSFGETRRYGDIEVTPHSAGHIPGAAMFELNGRETTLFTGDINTLGTALVEGAEPVKCDNLIIEGTYAGRDHPDRLKTTYRFIDKIEEVLDRGGVAVVPAFAVGRTQELLLALANTKFEVWLDGMGQKVNRLYLGENAYVRSAKKLRRAIQRANPVRNRHDREMALRGEVILTTSGMLDGGPVQFYLSRLCDDPKNAVLLSGYQVEGTNGRRLLDTGTLDLFGTSVRVECEVSAFDFSAHAGHRELLSFIRKCNPQKAVLMHSDNPSLIANDLKGECDTVMPKNGEELEI
jgi:putative mRNA 3-end processing factor